MPALRSCSPKPTSKKLDAKAPLGVVTLPSTVTRLPRGSARAASMVSGRLGGAASTRLVTSVQTASTASIRHFQVGTATACLSKFIALLLGEDARRAEARVRGRKVGAPDHPGHRVGCSRAGL